MIRHFSVGQVVVLRETGKEVEIIQIINKKVLSVFYDGEEHLIHVREIQGDEIKEQPTEEKKEQLVLPKKQTPDDSRNGTVGIKQGFYLMF